jgi:hypothetical protein
MKTYMQNRKRRQWTAHLGFCLVLVSLLSTPRPADAQLAGPTGTSAPSISACPNTWLRQGMIGVSTHFFPTRINAIDEDVNRLDTVDLANKASEMGAAWFMFTIHHQNWLMTAPNGTFARIVGSNAFMPRRDLPADLIPELKKRGIKLMLYVNVRLDPASTDTVIAKGMGRWPPDQRLVDNMAAVYREYSLRYGADVAGWWIDGAGAPSYANSPDKERWFGQIAESLKAGNPEAVVSFSPGLKVGKYSVHSNFTAGEMDHLTSLPSRPCIDGEQWHAWTYLGGFWGADGTRFSYPELCQYATRVVSAGGALTLDIGTWGIRRDGLKGKTSGTRASGKADQNQVQQIARLNRKLKSYPMDMAACDN